MHCHSTAGESSRGPYARGKGRMTRQETNGEGKTWRKFGKKERRKIQRKLGIKIYWRLLMLSVPCRHKLSTVRTAGNVCVTAGKIARTTGGL